MLIKDLFSEHMNEGRGVSRYPIIRKNLEWGDVLIALVFPCQYHSTSTSYLSSSKHCSYQKKSSKILGAFKQRNA